jgi:hypothetical protein
VYAVHLAPLQNRQQILAERRLPAGEGKHRHVMRGQFVDQPDLLELPPLLSPIILEKMDIFNSHGFDIEHFGKNTSL